MKRTTGILIAGISLLAIGAGVVAVKAFENRRSRTFWTDGGNVRVAVDDARPRTTVWESPTALGSEINSAMDEYEPRLSADGRTMLLVRGKSGENADIFVSQRTGWPYDEWGPVEAMTQVNTDADELGPELSRDGKTLYFHSNRAGGQGGYDVWRSQLGSEGWGEAQNLGPAVNSSFNEYGACLAPDGARLLFASNRPRADEPAETRGEAWTATLRENLQRHDFDLFECALVEGEPGDARRIVVLNSEANEGSPTFTPEGGFLWFCSDRQGGSGGFDLWRSRVVRGEFQQPAHVGPEVNSPFNELDPSLAMGGFELYFSSDRGGEFAANEVPRYDLFRSMSRDVFEEVDDSQPWIDWASVWSAILPPLMWLLLLLLGLLLLLMLIRGVRSRRLSLLVRCLLASLMVHVIVMMLLTLWEVTTSIASIIRPGAGTKVILSAHAASGELTTQIRGGPTAVDLSMPALSASERQAIEMPQREIEIESVEVETHPIEVALGRSVPLHEAMDSAPSLEAVAAKVEAPPMEAAENLALNAPSVPTPARQSEQTTVMSVRTDAESTRHETGGQMIPTATIEQPASVLSVSGPIRVEGDRATMVSASEIDRELDVVPSVESRRPASVPVEAMVVDASEMSAPREAVARAAEAKIEVSLPARIASESRIVEGGSIEIVEPLVSTFAPSPQPVEVATQSLVEMEHTDAAADANPPFTVNADAMPLQIEPSETGFGATMETEPVSTMHAATEAQSTLDFNSRAEPTRVAERAIPNQSAASENIKSNELPHVAIDVQTADSILSAAVMNDSPVVNDASANRRDRTDVSLLASDKLAEFNLGLPNEIAPPVNPYVQRAEDVRQDLVERLGGSDATEQAVNLALKWLAAHQGEDGRWASADFDDDCGECGGKGRFETDIATTGLALLCFLGADHTHMKDGPYRDRVDKAVQWLLAQVKENGDARGNETMYSHGIATIALSEAWGMTRDARLEEPVRKAIGFIVGARNRSMPAGGWRYEPGQMGDTSVLGWQVMAMVSGKRAGIVVEDDALSAAGKWIEHVSLEQRPGRYAYQPGQRFTPSMTAEGMFVLQLLGAARDEPRMNGSVEYVLEHPPHWDNQPNTYYWYYATLAMFQHQGEAWEQWNQTLTRVLLANQQTSGAAAGSWDPHDNWSRIGGRVYQTALCTLCLEVYYRYLPMYAATPSAKP